MRDFYPATSHRLPCLALGGKVVIATSSSVFDGSMDSWIGVSEEDPRPRWAIDQYVSDIHEPLTSEGHQVLNMVLTQKDWQDYTTLRDYAIEEGLV